MNGATHAKVVGESPRAPYYTEPLEIPTGIPKGLKVYNYVMNLCVIILIKPPYTDRFVRWCEGTGANHSLQLNLRIVLGVKRCKKKTFKQNGLKVASHTTQFIYQMFLSMTK